MPGETWHGAAAGYLGMWMAMMVPMMLPSLVPMLSRYQRSVRGATGIHRHGLTALVAAGYYVVWVLLGVVACAASAGVGVVAARGPWESVGHWQAVAAGIVLVAAGAVQFTSWKARQLVRCREGIGCGRPPAPGALGAWRHGLGAGLRCGLCCGNLMAALLAIGAMDLVVMAAATLAIAAERLAPAPLRVAQVAGVAILAAGLLTIVRG